MTTRDVVLLSVCAVLVLLPPRLDPAIRIKEMQMKGNHLGDILALLVLVAIVICMVAL